MTSMGQHLDRAQESYNQAMKKLSEGRGNLIAQSESFRHLGVEIKRSINPRLVEQALPEAGSADDDESARIGAESAPQQGAVAWHDSIRQR
ncbi:MAG: DNA recombination protein RmuC, partial [Pantoea sp.]|nr:DNA recombination protein RmuC [Pantoea sp.]